MKTIQDHLSIAIEKRDYVWITSALQIAIELEHATLPLYLSAMFAHKVQNYPSYNLFRSIVMEEMVHMAISCNVLAFIGGTPQIKNLSPAFPGKGLPGGAEPDVETVVSTFSKTQLQNFMRIEMPNFLLPDEFKTETYPTISKLYTAIQLAIQNNANAVRAAIKKGATSNQVGDDIGFTTFAYTEGIDPLPQLFAGFQEIIEQGEGNEDETLHAGPTSQEELSHYGRFAEIYFGHEYQKPASPVKITPANLFEFFAGAPVQFPDVVNTLLVPSDGYAKILVLDPNGSAVQKILLNFDTTYTTIMTDLENMWNGPANESWPKFGDAVGKMAEMRVLSCFYIMQNQIPADIVLKLEYLYPTEYAFMQKYTNLNEPIFYGPRFFNLNTNS